MSNSKKITIMGKKMYYAERLVKKQGTPCESKAKFTPNKFKVHRRG